MGSALLLGSIYVTDLKRCQTKEKDALVKLELNNREQWLKVRVAPGEKEKGRERERERERNTPTDRCR